MLLLSHKSQLNKAKNDITLNYTFSTIIAQPSARKDYYKNTNII